MRLKAWFPAAFIAIGLVTLVAISIQNARRPQSPRQSRVAEPASKSSGIRTAPKPAENPRAKEVAATIINLNGMLCAEVVSMRKLELENKVEVSCIEFRGGSNHVSYIVDTKSGKAVKI
ncbi:MAG: hypothetical protein F9K16_12740 [Thermoanaerobaculia bacterium]|nr:MAG: hypothetical protein F9K16_12740 [Thermoanaerobaculia bacterium]MBZ0101626.1 hypothetical protein [Thermoanaerobaculia bacterium]